MFQHDDARPHVARICTQFLEAENVPAYSDMPPVKHVWDALGRHFQQLRTGHNQQPDVFYAKETRLTA
jgi:hypothetical protein